MPDENTNTQEIEQPTSEMPQSETPGEPFDQERAMATIRNQREAERDLAKQLKALQRKVADYEKAEQERTDAEATELEKLQKQHTGLVEQYETLSTTHQRLQLRLAFDEAVEAEKLQFASPQARRDAFDLVDLSDAIGDDGEVDGKALTKAVKALQDSRAYLFGQPRQQPADDASARGQGAPEATDEEVAEFAAVMGLRPEFVDRTLLKRYPR
jgi:hypothetical protein